MANVPVHAWEVVKPFRFLAQCTEVYLEFYRRIATVVVPLEAGQTCGLTVCDRRNGEVRSYRKSRPESVPSTINKPQYCFETR